MSKVATAIYWLQ